MVDAHFNGALAAMHTYDHLCEIGHPDGSKGAALSHLARSLGVKREEVVAFGDSPNDIDMIEWEEVKSPSAIRDSPNDISLDGPEVRLWRAEA